MDAEYGQVAFDAYRSHVSAVTHDGKPIPEWGVLTDAVRGAWEAAAWAVLRTGQENLNG